MIQRIEPFKMTQRIEPIFPNMTQRFEFDSKNCLLFPTWLKELVCSILLKELNPFFFWWLKDLSLPKNITFKNWTFWKIWLKQLVLLQYDSKNWTSFFDKKGLWELDFFLSMTQSFETFWPKELNFCFKKYDSKILFNTTQRIESFFFLNTTQRIQPIFLKIWRKDLNFFLKIWRKDLNLFLKIWCKDLNLFLKIWCKDLNLFFSDMTRRFEPLFSDMTRRFEPLFFWYDSKIWTSSFLIWLEDLNLLFLIKIKKFNFLF